MSAGGDLPSAYREMPMVPEHTWSCIVASHSPDDSHARLRLYFDMLFGVPLAVTAFNRPPLSVAVFVACILLVLCSFYFDDLASQDWKSWASRSHDFAQSLDAPSRLRI